MGGPAWHRHCGAWERGGDCSLNERTLYTVLAVVWGLTVVAFVVQLCSPWCRRKLLSHQSCKAPSGYARWSLILTAISAGSSCLDAVLYLYLGKPQKAGEGYRHQPVQFAGSVFLTIALMLCARSWCDIAIELVEVSMLKRASSDFPKPSDDGSSRIAVISYIRHGYAAIAIVHVPITVFRVMAGQKNGTSLNDGILIYTVWVAFSAGFLLTVFAVLMCWIPTAWLRDIPMSRGLLVIGRVNLVQQALYDISFLVVAALFYSEGYSAHGYVQAAYFSLFYGLYWIMHAQVLLFYLLVDPTDPMYSRKAYREIVGATRRSAPECGDGAFFCGNENGQSLPTVIGGANQAKMCRLDDKVASNSDAPSPVSATGTLKGAAWQAPHMRGGA